MFSEFATKEVFELAKESAYAYMDGITKRGVFPTDDALRGLTAFDEALPDRGSSGREVIETLHKNGSPATVAQIAGRYFGFVNGGVVPAALAARWLGDAWDQNAALHLTSPIAAKLEQVCERWLVDIFDLPRETVIGLVTGTSIGTFTGLAAARYEVLDRRGWNVNEKGLVGAPRFRVVASEQAHATVFKALALLGIGRETVEIVPSDEQGRIRADLIPSLDETTILILQAGNVNTGAFDAFEEIAERANGAWIHIDGAFGLWAAASKQTRHLTNGIEKADSWSVDGHKTLNTPYDCGIVLCKRPRALTAAMQASGSYVQRSEERDGMFYGPDMSRGARSVGLWATLKFLGRSGLEQLIDGLHERARQFAEELSAHGFNVLNDVVFNQVLVTADDPGRTRSVLKAVQESGDLWCGPTTWNGEPAIRVSVCSWATTREEVTLSVESFAKARRREGV